MKHALALTTFVSAAALSLAACDSEDVENTPIDDVDEIADNDANQGMGDDAYPMGGDLDADQQSRYDEMDRQAVSDEYDRNRDAMNEAMQAGGGMADGSMAGQAEGGTSADASDSGDMADAGTSGNTGSASMMRPRSRMDFAFLDRNDDGELSVAEYAIWALPTDPSEPARNDAKAPYLTQSQINEAGQTFFYFDEDGDSYLSPQEFQTARNSARAP
ncbi:MAG: hypothetical protein CL803_12255 [Citromicrobium sp.]|nr:hypothetical protein [Citromicrobium sp.]|tara:strand:- start:29 stop:679 length:651 start_codon:yes stop_codon:yes gene_type:complete